MESRYFDLQRLALLGGLIALSAGAAAAESIDCSEGCDNVSAGSALFQTSEMQPAGTGALQTFVQLQQSGTEQGYNTTVNGVFDNKSSDTFNHELLLSDVTLVNIAGVDYREFILDANEPQSADQSLINLEGLQVYLSDTPNQSTTDVGSLGALVYDLAAAGQTNVILDTALNGGGSGTSDLRFLVPDALFSAAIGDAAGTAFVYLWSEFSGTAGGFEEWGVRNASSGGQPGSEVPEPASLALLGAAAVGAVVKRRKIQST